MWQRGPGAVPCLIHRDLSLSQWAPSHFSCCATWPRPCPFPLAAGGFWGGFRMDPRLGGLPQHPKPAACCGPHTPKPRSRPRWRWLHHMPVVLATGEDAAEPALACPLLLRGAALTRGCPLCSWILPAAFPSRAARESAASPGMWWLCPPHSHAAHGTGLSGGIWVPFVLPGDTGTEAATSGTGLSHSRGRDLFSLPVSHIPSRSLPFLWPCAPVVLLPRQK